MLTRRTFLAAAAAASAAPSRPPNVILIYADDLGYGDLSCYGGAIPTPHLDRLAAQGMRFTHCNSASPVCTPSRAALLTGRYPNRSGQTKVLFPTDTTGLPASEKTIPSLLKAQGYATACVGKWHLGSRPEFLPTRHGFDSYFGMPYSNDMNPRVMLRNEQIAEPETPLETLSPRYTEECLRHIGGKRPFFLYYAPNYPHIPLAASERFRGKSPLGIYGDVITELDASVGEIVAAVDRQKLDRDTLVVFSSDNGPWFLGSPGRLRGRKASTYEGGVRVPLIARWTGRIPHNTVANQLVSTMDLFPTIARAAGAPPPGDLDGMDLAPLFANPKSPLDRPALLYFDGLSLTCVRRGPWKLHLARLNAAPYTREWLANRDPLRLPQPELYDLNRDPDESFDVAPQHPEVVRDLSARAEQVLATLPEETRRAWSSMKPGKFSQPYWRGSFPQP